MKRFSVFLAIILLIPSFVCAYTITITDPVGDQIGSSVFDTTSITYTVDEPPTISITIVTNYPEEGELVGTWQTLPADLLLDGSYNGVGWDYAIPLVDHSNLTSTEFFTSGEIYSINSLTTSDDYAPSGGYIYNSGVPVWLESGNLLFTGNWDFSQDGDGGLIAYTEMNWYWLDEYLGEDDFLTIGWATATCANDPIGMNPVPEPATMLLLGVGLVGIAGFGRKKLFKY